MQLERLQAAFAAALVELDEFVRVAACFRQDDERVRDRFALYRRNVYAAWERALALAFPVVRALVDQEFFQGLAYAYACAHPSLSGDLNTFGANFATFVAEFEPAQTLPYLGDVAALEWAVHCAHHAADGDAFACAQVARMSPAELLTTRFGVHPALAWIESPYPIVTIWLAHRPDATTSLPQSLDRPECALIARPLWQVEVLPTGSAEIAALGQLRAGARMADAISAAFAQDASFDAAAALPRWIALGLLCGRPKR